MPLEVLPDFIRDLGDVTTLSEVQEPSPEETRKQLKALYTRTKRLLRHPDMIHVYFDDTHHGFAQVNGCLLHTDIRFSPDPGHTEFDVALIAKNAQYLEEKKGWLVNKGVVTVGFGVVEASRILYSNEPYYASFEPLFAITNGGKLSGPVTDHVTAERIVDSFYAHWEDLV